MQSYFTLKNFATLYLFSLSLVTEVARAQVHAPSAKEVTFEYEATFVLESPTYSPEEDAALHLSHLFGIFKSPEYVESYGIDSDKVAGIGVPRIPAKIRVESAEEGEDGSVTVKYVASGVLLLESRVAKKLLKNGNLTVPLPYEMGKIYNEKCTDHHYTSLGDYWYFYDIYREGCEYLQKSPFAKKVKIQIGEMKTTKLEESPRLDLLRGDNDNGDLFSIYVIHGFAESYKDPRDDGRGNYNDFNKSLRSWGFKGNFGKRVSVVQKDVADAEGKKKFTVEVRHFLVESSISSRGQSFAKFFKQAVEKADVLIYGGHSGLGGNLDIPSLEQKVGDFEFNPKKRQIFYFDSCSSYSYYLEPFRSKKRKSKIDVITNGLESYFHLSGSVLDSLMTLLIDPTNNPSWAEVLETMEEPLEGGSYLLNVGGV